MPAFILRCKDTEELFGLYAADTKYDLFDLIDEENDPFDYEFAALRFGYGIEFRKGEWPISFKIGSGDEALGAALASLDDIHFTGALEMALVDGEGLTWRSFPEDLPRRRFGRK